LNFLGVKDESREAREKRKLYCLTCKKAKKDDCASCEYNS
jgi:hypothetical protein